MKILVNIRWTIFICLLLLNSCALRKSQYVTKPSRNINEVSPSPINGVYAGFVEQASNKLKSITFYVFYQNGVVLSSLPMTSHNLTSDSIETVIRRAFLYRKFFDIGGYRIVDSSISIQLYRRVPGFAYDLFTYSAKLYSSGNIFINSCETKDRKDWCRMGYELKWFPIEKPDSTNRFLKKRWFWAK
jgi:hypothetical protein